jgi:hypothetical protein
MRIAIFLLSFGCAASAVCQSPAPKLLGAQPSGATVAQGDSSKPRLLTVSSPDPTLKAVPTQWPYLSIKAIPIRWPQFKLVLVDSRPVPSGAPAASPPTAK